MAWKLDGRDGPVLTVGQVAAILGVSHRTVAKLADGGELEHWTVPGSSHRRFARHAVEAFRVRHGIPRLAGAAAGTAAGTEEQSR